MKLQATNLFLKPTAQQRRRRQAYQQPPQTEPSAQNPVIQTEAGEDILTDDGRPILEG